MTGETIDEADAMRAAQNFPGLKGMDLAKAVATKRIYQWNDGSTGARLQRRAAASRLHVVAYDFGIKRNILRMLAEHGCRHHRGAGPDPGGSGACDESRRHFPVQRPGDPEPCDYAIGAIARFLETGMPLFGICLGHQLLGLASGAKTVKMKFGHHGANHPVLELDTGRVFISSQNHGFAVDERRCRRPEGDPSFAVRRLAAGNARTDRPAFSFQGHPEASPGPHDLQAAFEHFMYLMVKRVQATRVPRAPPKQKSAES